MLLVTAVIFTGCGGYGTFHYKDSRVQDELKLGGSSISISRSFNNGSSGEYESGEYHVEKEDGDVVYMKAVTKQSAAGMEVTSNYELELNKKNNALLVKMLVSGEAAEMMKDMGLSKERLFKR